MSSPSHQHTRMSAAKKYIQPYIHTFLSGQKKQSHTKSRQNNLTLNPDKTTCTMFTLDPVEYMSNPDLKINNTALPMATHRKGSGSYLRHKIHIQHTHSQHSNTHTQAKACQFIQDHFNYFQIKTQLYKIIITCLLIHSIYDGL